MAIEVACDQCGRVLKAKDSAAGKKAKCPQCGGIVKIPEPFVDAEEADDGGWGTDYGTSTSDDDDDGGYGLDLGGIDEHSLPAVDERKPCPMCGEMIVSDAAKCRYCGEVFDRTLKKTKKKKRKKSKFASVGYDEDESLSAGDWAVAVLCGNIGCIVGIVWMIQGKPKGIKMIGAALLFQFIWGFLWGFFSALQEAGQ